MKRNLFLTSWTLGILFPMGWFVRTSPVGYRLFNTMFSPAWTHIFMHSLLFAVLGALLMQSMYGRLAARAGVAVVLALLLGVGLLQEGIQLFSEQRVLNYGNFFDIGVDMLGGGLGLLLALGFRKVAATRAIRPLVLTK